MNTSKIMGKTAALLAAALTMGGALAPAVAAESPTEAQIRKQILPRLGPQAKIDAVKETPYSGLYEVRTGGDILYTDKNAQYLFVGHVFDAKTAQDLTKVHIEEMNKVKFSDLPLELAMKQVKGDGKRVIAVFEDPNCGYCKRFRQTSLKEMNNVTVYTFMYNILSPDSVVKSKDIWCAPDRMKAWDDWMLNNKAAPAAAAGCVAPHEQVLALGQKLHVNGTPSIFFADGTRIPGAVDAKALEAKLATVKQ